MLLAHPSTFGYRRAGFATKPIWVTKYDDGELYAAGEFTNQSTSSEGVDMWVARKDPIENEDVHFLFCGPRSANPILSAFGLTHNPRPEVFPVMPHETISVMLKPDGFFTKIPALDVPASTQGFNQSVLHQEPAPQQDCCGGSGGSGNLKAKFFRRID
ncbi:hypothetical protein N7501_000407 [Penicillium viridicatum]|nr:hypothetical protein N7501_000407 [Penicillium viridicatum]